MIAGLKQNEAQTNTIVVCVTVKSLYITVKKRQ
jgi:hypothetical protein